MWRQSSLKNIWGWKCALPVHVSVIDLHCKDMKTVKNEISASTGNLLLLGREMIKLCGLGTDLG